MQRLIEPKLLAWKNSAYRKPLVLRGARQTGKTYVLKNFAQQHFSELHYINFQENSEWGDIFAGTLTPDEVIKTYEILSNAHVDRQQDIIIFDEIQECPRALTSLKYFCELAPELAVCCAGSLLGVAHATDSFPVGRVTFFDLRPLSFVEFLSAIDEERLLLMLQELTQGESIPQAVHNKCMAIVHEYFIVGGMPEVVKRYSEQRDNRQQAFAQARKNQQDLLDAYVRDFAKYAQDVPVARILSVFSAIPSQLAKDSKKFIPSQVKKNQRHSYFESAIHWLEGAGLITKVLIANSGELPFSAFTRDNHFKLYFIDVGLLGALSDLSPAAFYAEENIFNTFKGAFCENFVLQELLMNDLRQVYSWSSNTAEIEFMIEHSGSVLPIEVKAGLSGKLKSLNVFADKYKSPYRTRISARNFLIDEQTQMHNYPLYLAYRFPLAGASLQA